MTTTWTQQTIIRGPLPETKKFLLGHKLKWAKWYYLKDNIISVPPNASIVVTVHSTAEKHHILLLPVHPQTPAPSGNATRGGTTQQPHTKVVRDDALLATDVLESKSSDQWTSPSPRGNHLFCII